MYSDEANTSTEHTNTDGQLVDRFARKVQYLRLSVTDRCNFRCRYCMPASGIPLQPSSDLLTFEEVIRVVRILADFGVRRVRITGGEPLVRRDLPTLAEQLLAVSGVDEVVLTTNGALLPLYARQLRDAGLREVTVSLDTLRPERFAAISRRGELDRVVAGIDAAAEQGLAVKLNAVVIRGFNDDEVVAMVQWALARGHLLRFIEFMPVGLDTIWGDLPRGGCVPAAEIRAQLQREWEIEDTGFVRGTGPARYLNLNTRGPLPKQVGRIGIIAAVTECFCAECNRIRLTPQGGLRACLADDSEVDLRALLRADSDDEAVVAAVKMALWGKKEAHRFDIDGGHVTLKQMVSIGG